MLDIPVFLWMCFYTAFGSLMPLLGLMLLAIVFIRMTKKVIRSITN
jgi:hypothetical protein